MPSEYFYTLKLGYTEILSVLTKGSGTSPVTLKEVELGLGPTVWLRFNIPRCLILIIYVLGKSHLPSCFLKIFPLDKTIFYEKKTLKTQSFTESAKLAASFLALFYPCWYFKTWNTYKSVYLHRFEKKVSPDWINSSCCVAACFLCLSCHVNLLHPPFS